MTKNIFLLLYASHTFLISLFLRVPYWVFDSPFAVHRKPHSWLVIASGLTLAFSAGDLSFFSHLQRGLGLHSLSLGLLHTAELLSTVAWSVTTSPASLAPVSVVICRGKPVVAPASPSACWAVAGLSWVGALVCLSGPIVVAGLFSASSDCSAEGWASPRSCSSVVLPIIRTTCGEDEAISLSLPMSLFCIPAAVSCDLSFGGWFTLLRNAAPGTVWAIGRSTAAFSCRVTSFSNFLDFLWQYLLWLISFPMIKMYSNNPASSLLQGTLRLWGTEWLWHQQSLYLEADTDPSFILVTELIDHSWANHHTCKVVRNSLGPTT